MVFCGVGSKACAGCRTRRIKCDQVSPACSQCLRAGKECSGYRDPVSLMFRDENERVIDKATHKARNPKRTNEQRKGLAGNSRPEGTPESTLSFSADELENAQPISFSAKTSLAAAALKDAGIKFFFENYVTVVPHLANDELDITSSSIWPEYACNESFYNATSSVGFAGLSNVMKDSSFMVIARQKYLATIQDITAALDDPSKSDLPGTFKSVMVLAAFELVNCTTDNIGSWGIHVDGGQAIVKLLQRSRMGLPAPVRMQSQFIFSVLIKCVQRGELPAESLLLLNEQCRKVMTVDDSYAASLVEITYRAIELYARTKSSQSIDLDTIFQEALLLDYKLENWASHLPQKWSFITTTTTDGTAYTYNKQTHVYIDVWCARIYNNYRWARILVSQLILVHMAKFGSTSSENATQWAKSSAVISETATDVCRSVSSHLRRYTAHEAMQYAVPPLSGCFLMLFPIAVAASAMGVPDELHNWAINMLEIIGNRMGIAQALRLIPLIRMQRENLKNGREGFFLFEGMVGPAQLVEKAT